MDAHRTTARTGFDDSDRCLDAWEAGGVRGLVVGRLLFADGEESIPYPHLRAGPTYRFEACNPSIRATDSKRHQQLQYLFDEAKKRGWKTMIFCPGQVRPPLKHFRHRRSLRRASYGCRGRSVLAFPQVDGGIVDGWTESSYELVFHHGNAVEPIGEAEMEKVPREDGTSSSCSEG